VGGVDSRSSEAGADAVGWSVGTGGVLVGGCVVAGAVVSGADGSEEGMLGESVGVGVASGVVSTGAGDLSTTGTISFPSSSGVGVSVGCGVVLTTGALVGFADVGELGATLVVAC
jgi:hypothetical protein